MSTAADDIYEGVGEAYDELRAELLTVNGTSPTLKLLKKVGETNTYNLLLLVPASWYITFENFRQQAMVKIARNDAPFVTVFYAMTDFAFNDRIYTIGDEDKHEPLGRDFFYAAFGNREQNNAILTPERIV